MCEEDGNRQTCSEEEPVILDNRHRLAMAAMIDLALHEGKGPVTLAVLAKRQHASPSNVELVITRLRAHKLILATKGPGGGYALSRPADTVSVADVLNAMGADKLERRRTRPAGAPTQPDMTRELWNALHSDLLAYVQRISLRNLADAHQCSSDVNAPDPHSPARSVSLCKS